MLKLACLMLPAPDELRLDALTLDVERKRVTLEVTATQTVLVCPGCSVASRRIHSHYDRTLADLAWADINVCLHLQVRKCFCGNKGCTQRIFTKRLPEVAAPGAPHATTCGRAACAWGGAWRSTRCTAEQ